MENFPLVSIVTPSYNTLKYIKETVKSINDQQYPNLQHIIMDGGSNDGTLEYGRSLKNTTFISEKDKGQSNAINKAFDLCKGDIIGWLNSDDTYNRGTINFVVKYFEANKNIEFIHSDVNIIDANSKIIRRSKVEELTLEKILFNNPIKQPALFMRKSTLDKLGRLNEDLHYVMDMEFWLRMILKDIKGVYISDKVLSNFRMMSGTKSVESAPNFLKEWKEVLENYQQNNFFKKSDILIVKEAISSATAYWHLTRINRKENRGNFMFVVKNFMIALKYNPSLIKNRGTWIFFIEGLIGLKIITNAWFRKKK